jgi:hypothetical protein
MRKDYEWSAVHAVRYDNVLHCKKSLVVLPSPAGMSLTILSLDGNKLIIPVQGEFGGKPLTFFTVYSARTGGPN